jgi:hypothetical protein
MSRREAEAGFEHAGRRYLYSVYRDDERLAQGGNLRAEDGGDEPMCLAVGGAWLIRGPRALLDSLARRRGMAFDDAGVFVFAGEDGDEETGRIPAAHVLFHFFELPAQLVPEPAFRRFVGAFALAALEADARAGCPAPAEDERRALRAGFAALAAAPGDAP